MPLTLFSFTFLSGVLTLSFSERVDPELPTASMVSYDDEEAFTESIPKAWKVTDDNPRAKGWRQIGVAPETMQEAMREVQMLMRRFGYTEKHDPVADECQTIMEFQREGGLGVMWMLWRRSDDETGYSWGVVK